MAEHPSAVTGIGGPGRRSLLAKVHVAPKALGMLEDDYRALLRRVTGRSSAADCDDRQLGAVVAAFVQLGFRTDAQAGRRPAPATHPVARKARALWISLHQLGAINDPSERALEAFGKRQLGVDKLQWADQSQGFRLIEALKAMAERHGWGQATPARMAAAERVRVLKDRLVGAQLARLDNLNAAPSGPIAGNREAWSDHQLDSAARRLASLIRDAEAAVVAR